VGGIEMDDVKVYGLNSKQKSYDITNLRYDYLSSSDDSFKEIKKLILDNRFRSKSVYEI
jgi:3-dehydroquinate dehydratase